MSERRVSQVVGQGKSLGKIFVGLQGAGNRTSDLGDFDGMGQPGSIVIPFVIDEHLSLVLQAPKSRGVDDAISVALESASIGVFLL